MLGSSRTPWERIVARLLYWLVGLTPLINGVSNYDAPEFKETFEQGLTPTLKISLGTVNPKAMTLRDIEEKLKEA